ncbi:hypothetical protein [Brotaphodocola sp.]|uniref:hypothetical protein n=1 Tax=Brotaphodocola sp. TaxID=3073577 RepID=UPI003D7D8CCC
MKRFRILGCLFVVVLTALMLSGCTRDRNNGNSGNNAQMTTQAQTGQAGTSLESGTGGENITAPAETSMGGAGTVESTDSMGTVPETEPASLDSMTTQSGGEESTGVIGGLADDLERAVTNAADEVTGR